MSNRQRRVNLGLLVAVLTLLVGAVGVTASQKWWPFNSSGTSHRADGSPEQKEREKREQEEREREQKTREQKERDQEGKEKEAQRPTQVWDGEVSLEVNRAYALDGKPITPLDSCTGCLRVGDYPEVGLALQAEKGVAEWTRGGRPSYSGCKELLETHSKQAIQLETSLHNGGAAPKGWLCAKSKAEEILLLQYLGEEQNGIYYGFAIAAWK
jgi:hypothetical protein